MLVPLKFQSFKGKFIDFCFYIREKLLKYEMILDPLKESMKRRVQEEEESLPEDSKSWSSKGIVNESKP